MKERKDKARQTSWVATSSLGIELAVVMGFGVYFGNKFDGKHGTEPLGILAGVFFGFIYGSYSFWKILKMNETKKKKDKKDSDASS